MSVIETKSRADSDDDLLRELSRTPAASPFDGTDRYQVRRCIGDGGFGVVYEVEDSELSRRLALKTLKRRRGAQASDIRSMKREFRAVADIVHPNLVGLHELTSDGARCFFTMDLVEGCDFLEYVCGHSAAAYDHTAQGGEPLVPRRDTSGILSEPRLRAALRQLVAGVHALHEANIIHRDLKPSNVLVEDDGRVVILDFGLAGGYGHGVDHAMLGAGTPVYMAPEQALGVALSPATDWYAVGVMLYEALTGDVPFDAASPMAIAHAKATRDPQPPSELCRVPEDLERLCLALLARDPRERPDASGIWKLLGDGAAASQPAIAPHKTHFVGRARELGLLKAAYEDVRTGRWGLVRLHGQPGVGKSALLRHFLAELDGHAVLLEGRCYEREAVPFKAFDGVIDALQHHLRQLPRNEASALMPRDIHMLAQLFPALDAVPAVRDVPRRQTDQLDPRERRTRAFLALKELLARLADKQPLVVVIDDLQWGDIDSARLISQLAAPQERPAMLLVLAHRADEASRSESLAETIRMLCALDAQGRELHLEPLSRRDSERLAAILVEDADTTPDAARAIAQRAEGHPLFMAELARDLVLRGVDDVRAPSLIDILWQRIQRLSEEARVLLETVAVAGQPRSSQLCFDAAGVRGAGLEAARLLRAQQLLRTGGDGRLDVFHDRVRDAVLARADASTQRMRHLALARSMEASSSSDLEALARHCDAGEAYDRATRYAEKAGDAAAATLAFERAAAMYELALTRRADASSGLRRKLADALLNAGSNVAAGEVYLQAAAHTDGEERIDLTRRAAEHLLTVGEMDEGYRAMAEAFSAVGEKLPSTLRWAKVETTYRLMRIRFGGFRWRKSDAVPREAVLRLDVLDAAARALEHTDMVRSGAIGARFCQQALKLGEPRRAALGLIASVVSLIPGQLERVPLVDSVLDRAEAIGQQLDDASVLARAASTRAKTYVAFGDLPAAVEHYDRAAAMFAEHCTGMATEQRIARGLSASCRLRRGDFVGARRRAESLQLDATARRDPVIAKAVYANVEAPLALAADDPERARHVLTCIDMEDRCTVALVRTESHAAVSNYLGDPAEAVAHWERNWNAINELGLLIIPLFRALAVRSYALSLLAADSSPRAMRRVTRLLRPVQRLRFTLARAGVSSVRGYCALRVGKRDEARLLLTQAAELFEQAGMPLDAAACGRRAAELAGDEVAIAEADVALRGYGVVRPERWTATVAPRI